MASRDFKRKLIAILSADVKEYSRLMRDDEDATIRTLTAYRKAIFDLVKQHRGHVVDSPGDNVLAQFGSIVDAVTCAVNIQHEIAEHNAGLPPNRQMLFRIGVNLGDVVEDEERIYGDGVNIAARVENLAVGGGICISGTVYDSIVEKLGFGFEYLGEHEVKNIDKPIRIYKIQMESDRIEVPYSNSKVKKILPLSDEPSIAVLPFVNMSEDPKQNFFCDGLTEGIIATLSKSPDLLVIARNSTFTYKGRSVKVQQVSEDLGVRYVLEGSVQKSGDRVRITAQLIDALTGKHMWAERYDREMKEIFDLQDEIAIHMLEAMQWKLTIGSRAREALGKGTNNIEAYLKLVEGHQYLVRSNPEYYRRARKMFEEAISLDPGYATPYIFLGIMHVLEVQKGWSESPARSIEEATKLTEKAKELDEFHTSLYILSGLLKLNSRQYDEALASYERAFELDPNNSMSLYNKGDCLVFMGNPQQAIPVFQKILRIDPLSPAFAYQGLGHANLVMENYEEAISYQEKVIEIFPGRFLPFLRNAGCYAALNKSEKARTAMKEALRIYPGLSTKNFITAMPYKDQVLKQRWISYLLMAGLPE
jgi:adenylate cyclase